MPNTATSVTVPGTARPWVFDGSGVDNATTPNIVLPFADNRSDGSSAGGATGQNTSYRYGRHHGFAGETNPVTVAVRPLSLISIKYVSGTIATQASGAGSSTPGGSPTDHHLDLGPNESDDTGYSYPSNYIAGCTTKLGGLVGCFTDSSGNVISGSFWDWTQKGGGGAGGATGTSIGLIAPAGAAYLSMGILDSALDDNTGSFSLTVYNIDDVSDLNPHTITNQNWPKSFPMWECTSGTIMDVLPAPVFVRQLCSLYYLDVSDTNGVFKGCVGQLFPRGNFPIASAAGQNFPY